MDMLLGLPSGAFHRLSSGVQQIINAVRRIHELGFELVEIHGDVEAFYPNRLRVAIMNMNLDKPYTVHLPFVDTSPGSPIKEVREASEKIFARVIEATRPLNPIHYVFHPLSMGEEKAFMTMFDRKSLEDLEDRVVEMHEILGDYVGVHGRVLIENMERLPIERREKYIEDYEFYGCFDVGHAVLQGKDPVEVLQRVGKYVREIHLHDVLVYNRLNGSIRIDHMPPESGIVSFMEILELAKKFSIPVVILEVFNPQYALRVAEWAKKHSLIRTTS